MATPEAVAILRMAEPRLVWVRGRVGGVCGCRLFNTEWHVWLWIAQKRRLVVGEGFWEGDTCVMDGEWGGTSFQPWIWPWIRRA